MYTHDASIFRKTANPIRPTARGWLGRLVVAGMLAILGSQLAACNFQKPEPAEPSNSGELPRATLPVAKFPVVVRRPVGPPRISTGILDEKGTLVSVTCAACHTTKPANPDAKLGVPPVQFHQGLTGKHGNLSCVSCHNPTDGYSALRLADGKSVSYTEVMTLCAQCHGPQFRDYQHGAHGGMTGHWDLTQGGRVRNNCIDCHDPHAPKYPTVYPARGPHDRFQTGGAHE